MTTASEAIKNAGMTFSSMRAWIFQQHHSCFQCRERCLSRVYHQFPCLGRLCYDVPHPTQTLPLGKYRLSSPGAITACYSNYRIQWNLINLHPRISAEREYHRYIYIFSMVQLLKYSFFLQLLCNMRYFRSNILGSSSP